MTLPTLLLLALSLQAQNTPLEDLPSTSFETRAYSLRGLEPQGLGYSTYHYPMSPFHWDGDHDLFTDKADREYEFDGLVNLLVSCFLDDFEYTEAYVDIDGDQLNLHGRSELHAGSEALMRYWRDEVLRPTSVRISRGQVDSLQPLYDMQLVSSSQREVRRTRLLPTAFSPRANIATRARSFEPHIRPLMLGDLQLATADTYGNGSLVSWLTRHSELFRTRDREAIVQTQLTTDQMLEGWAPKMDLPDPIVVLRSIATTAALRENSPLEIESSGLLPGGAEWQETQVMESTQAMPAAVHDLSALCPNPVALVSLSSITPNRWSIHGYLRSSRGGWSNLEEPPYYLSLERSTDAIDRLMRKQLGGDVHFNAGSVGPFALVTVENGTEESDATLLQRWLASVEASTLLPKQLEVSLRLERTGPQEAFITLRGPLSSGSALAATLGTERLAHTENESYVAEGSSISLPVLKPSFQGMMVHLEPVRLNDDSLIVSLSLEGSFRRGDIVRETRSGIECERFDRLSLRETSLRLERAEDGSWRRRYGSLDDEALSLLLEIRER